MGRKPKRTRSKGRVDLKGRSFNGIRGIVVDASILDYIIANDEQRTEVAATEDPHKLEKADLREARLGISDWRHSGSKERG